MEHPQANLLVIRKVYRTLKDSCFNELQWAIKRLQVQNLWSIKYSPLEMTYKPTGQKIFFRGLDDPLKITSITVNTGYLCWAWIEEAYEISNEADFDMLDESIRGFVPDTLFKQITLTLNPWNEKHWIKKRFFDTTDVDVLAKTTNYKCNEFLDKADLKVFKTMEKNNPRRYAVAGLGDWGIVDGLVYENFEELKFDVQEVSTKRGIKTAFGLDFGYTIDPTALFCGMVDVANKEVYVFDELYKKSLSNEALVNNIKVMGYAKETIIADSEAPKDIDDLRYKGLRRIKPAKKGADSVNHGIQKIQDYKIYIHPKCVNFLTEISNYTWAMDRFGNRINKPIGDFNHLMDAFRYAMEDIDKGSGIRFLK